MAGCSRKATDSEMTSRFCTATTATPKARSAERPLLHPGALEYRGNNHSPLQRLKHEVLKSLLRAMNIAHSRSQRLHDICGLIDRPFQVLGKLFCFLCVPPQLNQIVFVRHDCT